LGRIADALKRAEQEREKNLSSAGAAVRTGSALPRLPAKILDPISEISAEAAAPPTVVEGLAESLIPFHERASLVTEQYRSLRTRLISANPNYEHRLLAVTSAVPKEGKSVTTLNLGCILAEIRHLRVCVVDGDFRRSSLAHMLNQPTGPGFADVLADEATFEQVVQSTPIPNLTFIPAGSTKGRSAAELLTAASAQAAFNRLRDEYHYTIVDTPPATTVTDVGIIGQMCDGVIMIVRLHRTHEATAKRAVRLLQVNNIPIVGCLLVGRDGPASGYYGYGYRSNYYRYYDSVNSEEQKVG
jgi:capsular exopolysaccharide synthesis family protein